MSDLDLYLLSVCAAFGLVALGMHLEKHDVLPRLIRWARGMAEPTYNHTRGDSPLTPCPECAPAQRLYWNGRNYRRRS